MMSLVFSRVLSMIEHNHGYESYCACVTQSQTSEILLLTQLTRNAMKLGHVGFRVSLWDPEGHLPI